MLDILFIERAEAHDVKWRQVAKFHVGLPPSVEIDILAVDLHRPCGTEVKVAAIDQHGAVGLHHQTGLADCDAQFVTCADAEPVADHH